MIFCLNENVPFHGRIRFGFIHARTATQPRNRLISITLPAGCPATNRRAIDCSVATP
jgi:hypothetical protein